MDICKGVIVYDDVTEIDIGKMIVESSSGSYLSVIEGLIHSVLNKKSTLSMLF